MENTSEQNLDLIQKMIKTAQRQFADNSGSYLLWGFTVSIACIAQYILIRMNNAYNYLGWLILVPIALVAQFILMRRKTKNAKVRTHIESVLGYMWIAFGVSLGIVLSSASRLGLENTYPIVLCLYAISLFVSGGAMKTPSLIVGGIACWVFAIACFFVHFETQLLLLALAVVVAYIIPGFIIRKQYKLSQSL